MSTRTVVCQKWEESELGWGTRPDGYSLHLSERIRKQFIKDYWDSMPDAVPDCYSRPNGASYLVGVGEETYTKLASKNGSVWFFGRAPSKDEKDVWNPVG